MFKRENTHYGTSTLTIYRGNASGELTSLFETFLSYFIEKLNF